MSMLALAIVLLLIAILLGAIVKPILFIIAVVALIVLIVHFAGAGARRA
jgi:hypothetical protein